MLRFSRLINSNIIDQVFPLLYTSKITTKLSLLSFSDKILLHIYWQKKEVGISREIGPVMG
jgi:hypothetical protein